MATNWTIAIDWDRNGNYSDTYDDVTSRMIEANWFLGFRKSYDDVADDSMFKLVLDNSDKRYSPEHYASPLYGKLSPYKPLRIQSNDGTTRTHWIGWIESIQPKVNQFGERTVEITAAGPMMFCESAETKIALQENQRTDQIIETLLKEVVIPPALTSAWVLGRIGFSDLGLNTRLADLDALSDLDEGRVTLALAADNWVTQGGASDAKQDTYNVYKAIADVVAAERGKFFFSRDGKAVFWNRHHLLDDEPVAVALNDSMTGLKYTYAGLKVFKNEVIVTCHPRTLGTALDEVLWSLDSDVTIAAGKEQTLSAKYRDGSDNRIGGKNVSVTDIVFKEGSASVTLEASANSAKLTVNNTNNNKNAVLKSCKIKGQKITDFGRMEASAQNNASIIDFGRRTFKLNLPSVDNLQDAQIIADFELRRRAQPRGLVGEISLVSHATQGGGLHAQQLERTIGDLILVSETQAGFSTQRYFIIGEAHKLTKGGDLYETTWYLEPAPAYSAKSVTDTQIGDLLAYWKLGDISGAVLSDSSGNNRNGTISGALWGQPGIGDGLRAARFDGVNDYANPYSSSFNGVWNGQEFTISGWFKVADSSVWTDGQTRYIFSFRNQDTPVDSIALHKDSNNQLTCEYSANGTTKSVTVTSYSPTEWVHFAVTVSYSGDAMKFYLDGVQKGSTQNGLGQWNNGQALQTDIAIGAQDPSTNFWKGDLAHFAVWDRVLTVGEIISLKPVFPWRLGIPGRSELSAATLLTY